MSPTARSALAAFAVLAIVGLAWPAPIPDQRPDSYGRTGQGLRALFELLDELGMPVRRSATRSAEHARDDTVWFLQPWTWCARAATEDQRGWDADEDAGPDLSWLERGGTAVVALPTWLPSSVWNLELEDLAAEPPRCEAVSGFPLPPRELGQTAAGEPVDQDEAAEGEGVDELIGRWWRAELDRSPVVQAHAEQRLEGTLVPRPRSLPTRPLLRFGPLPDGSGFEIVARLDGEPFALERRVGAGRLVVLADAGFLLNRWLDVGDAAPVAVDLVRAYGTPIFDERIHGHTGAPAVLPYLAGSPAFPVLVGLAVLGLLLWAHGSAWPPRDVREADEGAPALEPFVDGLAALYAGSRDWPQLARRYRALSIARLRRHFAFPADLPEARLLERLRRDLPDERARWLDPATVEAVVGPEDLDAVVTRLDELVTEVCT